jgi:SnoaL-like protein
MGEGMVDAAAVNELLGRWWFNYDQGNFDVLETLLTDDVHFSCRTDTGKTAYEDFVRSDQRGLGDVMAWQREHRLDSPYPLRHMGLNVHVTGQRGEDVTFSSYIFVTQIADGAVSNLSTAIVTGAVRRAAEGLRLSELEVVLDTEMSAPLRAARSVDERTLGLQAGDVTRERSAPEGVGTEEPL